MKTTALGSIGLIFVLALAGCGDDGGGGGETGDSSTGSATAPSTSSTMSTSSSTSETDSSSTGEPTSSTGTDTDTSTDTDTGTDTDPSTGTGSTESEGSSSTGMMVDDCDACTEDQVCVEDQSFMNTYTCAPMPKACEGEVDCECGGQLCDETNVCNDMGPANMLTCICIDC
jgi:hypothetical protein